MSLSFVPVRNYRTGEYLHNVVVFDGGNRVAEVGAFRLVYPVKEGRPTVYVQVFHVDPATDFNALIAEAIRVHEEVMHAD